MTADDLPAGGEGEIEAEAFLDVGEHGPAAVGVQAAVLDDQEHVGGDRQFGRRLDEPPGEAESPLGGIIGGHGPQRQAVVARLGRPGRQGRVPARPCRWG